MKKKNQFLKIAKFEMKLSVSYMTYGENTREKHPVVIPEYETYLILQIRTAKVVSLFARYQINTAHASLHVNLFKQNNRCSKNNGTSNLKQPSELNCHLFLHKENQSAKSVRNKIRMSISAVSL